MKRLVKLTLLGLTFLAGSCSSEPVSEAENLNVVNAKASKSTVDVFDGVNGVVAGSATLKRNANGITINFKATGLTPGYAYTLWWVIWNNPENCVGFPGPCGEADLANATTVKVELLTATGHVVGASGIGYFSAHLNENDSNGTVNPLLGLPEFGGLLDAETAEVHGVLRSHGPAIPGMVNEQISTYVGGCTDPFAFPPFSEIPDAEGECADIYASIHQAL